MPGHVGVYSNKQADIAAKFAATAGSSQYSNYINDCNNETEISLTYLRNIAKKSLLQSWYNYYNSVIKGAYYQNLAIKLAWKPLNLKLKTSRKV